MQHEQLRFTQHLIMALFAIALVVVGWQVWVMANANVDQTGNFLGWFMVVACAVNLVWLVWFYAKRWFSPKL